MAFPKGVIGITAHFLGRYREFDVCKDRLIVPQGTLVNWWLGVNIAHNFNNMVRAMLAEDYQWLWILGDDHVFKPDLLMKLLERQVDMITPLCLRRTKPYAPVIHDCADNGYGRILFDFLKSKKGVIDITDKTTGNAGTLIQRHIFEAIPTPWFENGKTNPEMGGSDLYFCEKVRKAGFKMYLDLGNMIGHVTHAAVWPKLLEDGSYDGELIIPSEGYAQEENLFQDEIGTKQDWIEVFNDWRTNYDKLSYPVQGEVYNRIAQAFPNQNRYDIDSAEEFFRMATKTLNQIKVLEIGGWTGTVAEKLLPKFESIAEWHNIEICSGAVDKPLCKSDKYKAETLKDFIWKDGFNYRNSNVLFLSHVLEHMRLDNFLSILNQIKEQEYPIRYIFIDSPIAEKSVDVNWQDYFGTHIFEIGWDLLEKLLDDFGYSKIRRDKSIGIFERLEPREIHSRS